mgnify:CR=1 FL=1
MPILEDVPEGIPKPQFGKWSLEDALWVSQHWDELRSRYAGLYIAVHRKQVIDHDRDRDALEERLRRRFERPEAEVLIIYIPPGKIKMLI